MMTPEKTGLAGSKTEYRLQRLLTMKWQRHTTRGWHLLDSKELILEVLRDLGKREATELRQNASEMDGTAIIAMDRAVPAWNKQQDYTGWPAGAPVADEGQVWLLIQPHRAADYEGRPSTLRALWGLAHTKDPTRAKPWVDPYGTSGMYMTGECYRAEDGTVYRCKQDNCVYDAQALPSAWEEV